MWQHLPGMGWKDADKDKGFQKENGLTKYLAWFFKETLLYFRNYDATSRHTCQFVLSDDKIVKVETLVNTSLKSNI